LQIALVFYCAPKEKKKCFSLEGGGSGREVEGFMCRSTFTDVKELDQYPSCSDKAKV